MNKLQITNNKQYQNNKPKFQNIFDFNNCNFGIVCILLLVFCCLFAFPSQAAIITNIEPTSLSDSSFIITWTTTDEKSSTEIHYGVGGLTNVTTVAGTTKYHYAELPDLSPNTTYQYKIKSGSTLYPPNPVPAATFTTLARPTGEHLFDFAVINDLRYANGKTDTSKARGIAYSKGPTIISQAVADINSKEVAFTVVNGNIVDSDITAKYGDQANTEVRPKLELLNNKPADLTSNVAYKYMPVPGYYDKINTGSYTTDWITNSFKPLTSNTSIESNYGYNAASKDADSVFNYQFKYKYYNFIFLDVVKRPGDAAGSANLNVLNSYLSAESNSKTFIFMSYPAYSAFGPTYTDYPVSLPTTEVGGALCIANDAAFRATLEAYKDSFNNPIVAAVVSGHLGDNYLRTIEAISYVRQGPAVQFPTGYSIYKVYTNGYIKSFYKTTGGSAESGDTKPYYEYARDQISAEAGLPAEVLTTFWLGSSSMRNFTYSYPFIPGVSPEVSSTNPASNESAVTLNRPIIVTFKKSMLNQNISDWLSVSPSVGTLTARFLDSSNRILSVSHSSDFAVNTTYTVTVDGSKAKDEGSTIMGSNYTFTFNTTGGTKKTTPPSVAISPFASNTTTDRFPTLTGIASDDSGVTNVEYRVDATGSWASAEAFDGTFNSTSETFKVIFASPLSLGSHQLYIRATNGAGIVSSEGVAAYSFSVAEQRPTITININGRKAYNGDTISSTPKIELAVNSLNGIAAGNILIRIDNNARVAPTITQVDTTYYATYEVTSALADGSHGITVEAVDQLNNCTTSEMYPLYVQASQSVAVIGQPLNYPNPYDPASGNTSIGYTLSKPAAITLTIHDLAGNLVTRKTYSANASGGLAGYNAVPWDGKSDTGSYVGNGIYIYLIIADGKVVSRGKLTVVKR